MERLPSFRSCYFCGTENRAGFAIAYQWNPGEERVEGWVEPDASYCGYPGILHGGLQSALLDDVMYWAVAHRAGISSVTLRMESRFLRPAALGQSFLLAAQAREPQGRKVWADGRLIARDGQIVAEGAALYLLHSRADFVERMLPLFDFQGCSGSMIARFMDVKDPPSCGPGTK